MIAAVERWYATNAANSNVSKNLTRLISEHRAYDVLVSMELNIIS